MIIMLNVLVLASFMHSAICLVFPTITLTNSVLLATPVQYTFNINRPFTATITAGSVVVVQFPSDYDDSFDVSCKWGSTDVTQSCNYSERKLTIQNQFPNDQSPFSIQFSVQGIKNPAPAATYNLIYKVINGGIEIQTATASVLITMGNAKSCSVDLSSCKVFQMCTFGVSYQSEIISSIAESQQIVLEVRMSESYAQDGTNTDIDASIEGSTSLGLNYVLQIPYQQNFDISMLMPPSTERVVEFIYIKTSSNSGSYDFCYLDIILSTPSQFESLVFTDMTVQQTGDLNITFIPHTPIVFGDQIQIDFTQTTFDVSSITTAKFHQGILDQRTISQNQGILTISDLITDGTPPIQGSVLFTLKNIIAPLSHKPQLITISTISPPNFKKDQSVFQYTAQTGSLSATSFTCQTYQIGRQTLCIFSTRLQNSLPASGSLQIEFAEQFTIPSTTISCTVNGGSLSKIPVCMGTSDNKILISQMSVSGLSGNKLINLTIPMGLPISPQTSQLVLSTLDSESYVIDRSSVDVSIVKRQLVNEDEVTMSFDTQYTSSSGDFTIIFSLPLQFPDETFTFESNLSLIQQSNIRDIENDFLVTYTYPNLLINSAIGTDSTIVLTGFLTPQSTKPIYISGSLSINGIQYFYFDRLKIAMSLASQFSILSMSQSNNIVGRMFTATITISGLNANDYVEFPEQSYADDQSDCSQNCECLNNGRVIILNEVDEIMVNLLNPSYLSNKQIIISSYDEDGFVKQRKTVLIKGEVLNSLTAVYSQTHPYLKQESIYRINISLSESVITNRLVKVTVPSGQHLFQVKSASCTLGCTVDSNSDGVITVSTNLRNIRIALTMVNPSPADDNSFDIDIKSMSTQGFIDEGYINFTPTCQLPCRSCANDNAASCNSCYSWLLQSKYRNDTKTCVQQCNDDQFCLDSLTTPTCLCTPCPLQCTQCIAQDSCQACSQGFYLFANTCGVQCPSTYFEDSQSYQCLSCPSNCLTCSDAQTCLVCQNSYYLFNGQCMLNCPQKSYASAPTAAVKLCYDCPIQCFSCVSLSECTACQTDYTLSSKKCLGECPRGQYIQQTEIDGQVFNSCKSCLSPCATCVGTSTTCTSCSQNFKLYPFNSTCVRNCPTNSFYNNETIQCQACHESCEQCTSGSQNSCLVCSDELKYLQQGKCVDQCQILHANNDLMICEACRSPCLECTQSSICLSCVANFNFLQAQNKCYRSCPSTYYAEQGNCVLCSSNSNCNTCRLSEAIICTSCLSGYIFYGDSCITSLQCTSPNYVSGSYCLSPSCNSISNCLTCSGLRCLQCKTNFTLTSSNQCAPIQEDKKQIAAVSELPVPFPFVIAAIVIIVIAFLIRLQFPKMFAPLFIYAFMGIAEAGLFALWILLIHIRTIEDSRLATYLKLAAIVICFVYVGLNVLAFFFFICLIKKDRKYRVWEKQDNLCASTAITIVALFISFRFDLLKYSKLAHSQKFSATVANDSKISYGNLFAYISIGIISIPAIVVSGWISYLQITMNYLFFTSMQVTVFSIMMIIMSILQSFTPKGYAMENKAEYKQGNDQQNMEGQSLDQVMMGIDVVEEEYHEGKQIDSKEDQVGNRNNQSQSQQPQKYTYQTGKAFASFNRNPNYSANDQPLQFQDIRSKRTVFAPIDERQELQNILLQAEKLAKKLQQPSRPVGVIRRQNPPQLVQSYSQSEGIQSSMDEDDDFPAFENPQYKKDRRSSPIKDQTVMPINSIIEQIELGERKVGMNKLKILFEQLEMKEAEERALTKRLQQVSEEQKKLKQKEYEKTRQIIQRNQMALEDKMGKIKNLFSQRMAKEQKRKQKIKQMEMERKKQREQKQKSIKIDSLVYPPQDIEVQLIHVRSKQNKQLESPQKKASKWQQKQQQINFQENKQWKITEEQGENQKQSIKNQLQMSSPLKFESIGDPHWPIDIELQAKIAEVQERADKYIEDKNIKIEMMEDYGDVQLISSSGADGEDLIYMEQDEQQGDEEHKYVDLPIINESGKKIPKFRVNRDVINLSPE